MAAQLAATVYVRDPDTRQTVELAPGTCPEPRLAALVTNPAAWVGGKLPRLPKPDAGAADGQGDGSDPTGDGQGDASGADSAAAGESEPDEQAAPAAAKTAAKKTAASSRSRGRAAAGEGTSGE